MNNADKKNEKKKSQGKKEKSIDKPEKEILTYDDHIYSLILEHYVLEGPSESKKNNEK